MAIPKRDTTAGRPKLGKDELAPETALVAAAALMKQVEMYIRLCL